MPWPLFFTIIAQLLFGAIILAVVVMIFIATAIELRKRWRQ